MTNNRKPSGKKGVAYREHREVKVGNLAKEIRILLDEYTEEVQEALRFAVPDIAKKAQKQVAANAKEKGLERTGDYIKGWTVKKTNGVNFVSAVVHNKDRYRIAHLLEHGHAMRDGKGRVIGDDVKGIEHIKPAEEWANNEMAKIWDKLGI